MNHPNALSCTRSELPSPPHLLLHRPRYPLTKVGSLGGTVERLAGIGVPSQSQLTSEARRKRDNEVNTFTKWLMAVALLSGPVVANAALVAVDGGLLVSDPDANLTWVSDANLMATQIDASCNAAAFVETIINDSGGTITGAQGTHALSSDDFVTTNGVNSTIKGQMTWYGAQAWVHYLDTIHYQGFSDWRLPTTADNSSSLIGFGGSFSNPSSAGEMGHLFYGELGQVLGQSITTTHNDSYALFSNVQDFQYWYGTECIGNFYPYCPSPGVAWAFYANSGYQGLSNKPNLAFALAVRNGAVAPFAALLTEVTGVGPGRSLADKVALAQTYYAVPDIQATCAVLTGFINEVQAQSGKKISPQLDAKLIADAQAIEAAIGCK
jgi:hypothetical protein